MAPRSDILTPLPFAFSAQFHKLYVEKLKWIDEQTYLELFAVVQATPGPGSTKMLAAIHMGKGGLPCALLALAFWWCVSLPQSTLVYYRAC